MAIPDYQDCMLPLLNHISSGQEFFIGDVTNALADEFGLTQEERNLLLPSGTDTYIRNRVGWARTYLKKAGLLESPRRAYIKLSSRGNEVLESKPSKIDNTFLKQFPEFVEFKKWRPDKKDENHIHHSHRIAQTTVCR